MGFISTKAGHGDVAKPKYIFRVQGSFGSFQLFSKFRGMFISGVNDNKFITGVINTAEQLSPVTTTLAINLSLISTTLLNNNRQ
jgi:hypothetical protein